MTPRVSHKNPLRTVGALLAGCLLLLSALPYASAVEVSHDDADLPTDKGACERKTYVGSGSIDWRHYDWVVKGGWTNGCGGNACDDEAHGTVYNDNGAAGTTFYITEYREDGKCRVQCGIADDPPQFRDGYVSPKNDGHPYVDFECWGVFIGHMGDGRETLNAVIVHVAHGGPGPI